MYENHPEVRHYGPEGCPIVVYRQPNAVTPEIRYLCSPRQQAKLVQRANLAFGEGLQTQRRVKAAITGWTRKYGRPRQKRTSKHATLRMHRQGYLPWPDDTTLGDLLGAYVYLAELRRVEAEQDETWELCRHLCGLYS